MSGQPRIAWGITGAGHFLSSCVKLLESFKQADVFFSAAGLEVVRFYELYDQIRDSSRELFFENDASSLPVTRLYKGAYDLAVIAPATSNSIAKMVLGISDSLVTNLFAHAGKCQVPIVVLPCDTAGDIKSVTHKGEQVSVHIRPVDRDNAKALSQWQGVTLVYNPTQLGEVLSRWQGQNIHL